MVGYFEKSDESNNYKIVVNPVIVSYLSELSDECLVVREVELL